MIYKILFMEVDIVFSVLEVECMWIKVFLGIGLIKNNMF